MLREEIDYLIKKYKLWPNPELDQFFLVNDNALIEILKRFKRRDIVFQIGLGLGTISYRLASRVKLLIVCEIDKRLVEIFKKEFGKKAHRMKIIVGDALKIKWPKFNKFFSSLPFTVAEQIIRKLEKVDFELGVLIMPKSLFEKRKRFRLNFEEIMGLSRKDFYPEPDTEAVLVEVFK